MLQNQTSLIAQLISKISKNACLPYKYVRTMGVKNFKAGWTADAVCPTVSAAVVDGCNLNSVCLFVTEEILYSIMVVSDKGI